MSDAPPPSSKATPPQPPDTRISLEDLEIQRFFFAPSFEVYGGVAGLYDLGPVGCNLERNILNKWRDHFVIEDDMCEVRCSMLTPYRVLEASGHTAKFSDFMVSDSVNFRLYRADHIIEQALEARIAKSKNPSEIAQLEADRDSAGDLKADGLEALITKYGIRSADGNPLTKPVPFNLMFNTHIGPGQSAIPGFLRPETAQGIFVNFPRLFEFQRGRLPFACAQQGVSYRNEIAPRNGLVRCREFMMAEIEHFADPGELDDFPKFASVADLVIQFLSAPAQEANAEAVPLKLQEAVEKKIVCHKTMGYYIGRTFLFMTAIGINPDRLRFRQHRLNEKAHYARDCWDCELQYSGGWLECAGMADRQSFDLTQHSLATARSGEKLNPQMSVQKKLDSPVQEERLTVIPNKGFIGKQFRAQARDVLSAFESLSADQAEELAARVSEAEALLGGKPAKGQEAAAVAKLSGDARAKFEELTVFQIGGVALPYSAYTVTRAKVTVTSRQVIPCVIEPSFGIGRILTVLLEHAFYVRDDGLRRVLRLPAFVAPYKCVVLPLGAKIIPSELVDEVRRLLRQAALSHQTDSSGVSIGKRYARVDELGVPYAITLDPVTVADRTVTLRERDSTAQIRLGIREAIAAIQALTSELDTWANLSQRYPAVAAPPPSED
jgi:glycyl-tRNA synthetase